MDVTPDLLPEKTQRGNIWRLAIAQALAGANAVVLESHRPEEKTRVQSFNDFIVFGLMALGSFSSGGLLPAYGWNTVLWVSFVPLVLAVVALALAARRQMPDAAGTPSTNG
ncbi:hypothetical protein [Thauera butanivorans]|jgi:predicted MFS family arabinose efflux permease|uniref:hypothetical protein n=1 Tax=Thauera butanivorans TaxID=86174 RepID=UPI000837F046|nr:hypothetical protein [Thauera butanivorans]